MPKAPADNFLDYVPSRVIGHEDGEDGKLTLLRPKFVKGPLASWLQRRVKHKYFRVTLDELGTASWQAIDGKRNVAQIADLLFDRFGERVEPRYDRMSRFIDSLARSSMVTLDQPAATEKE